jgi:DNA-binding MarR family transcriptional regulator
MSTFGNDAGVEHDIYHMLTKTFLLLDDYDRQFFADYGLSTRQYWALQHLGKQQGCSMVNLSRVLFTDKSNVTGIIDRLECLNLVTRTSDVRDRRVILLTLTPKGHALYETVREHHIARIHDVLHAARDTQQDSLLNYLDAISRNIEAYLGHS